MAYFVSIFSKESFLNLIWKCYTSRRNCTLPLMMNFGLYWESSALGFCQIERKKNLQGLEEVWRGGHGLWAKWREAQLNAISAAHKISPWAFTSFILTMHPTHRIGLFDWWWWSRRWHRQRRCGAGSHYHTAPGSNPHIPHISCIHHVYHIPHIMFFNRCIQRGKCFPGDSRQWAHSGKNPQVTNVSRISN